MLQTRPFSGNDLQRGVAVRSAAPDYDAAFPPVHPSPPTLTYLLALQR